MGSLPRRFGMGSDSATVPDGLRIDRPPGAPGGWGDPRMAGSSLDHEHGGLYGPGAAAVQSSDTVTRLMPAGVTTPVTETKRVPGGLMITVERIRITDDGRKALED